MINKIKIIYFLPFLGLMACLENEPYEPDKLGDISKKAIVFYNVENLFDTINDPFTRDDDFTPKGKKTWTKERFNKKIDGIAKVITSIDDLNPVFVGLAEVENEFCLEEIIGHDSLQEVNYKWVHQDSNDGRGMDVALLYRADLVWLATSEFLSIQSKEVGKSRDILYAKFKTKEKETIHIYTNHWPSRREGKERSEKKRMAASKVLRSHIDKQLKENEHSKILVLGDFNDYPTDKSIRKGLEVDSFSEIFSSAQLYNLSYEKHSEGEGSYYFKGSWGMLDQIIATGNLLNSAGGLRLDKDNFGIFDADWLLYRNDHRNVLKPNRTYSGRKYYGGYSDHLPVYIKFE